MNRRFKELQQKITLLQDGFERASVDDVYQQVQGVIKQLEDLYQYKKSQFMEVEEELAFINEIAFLVKPYNYALAEEQDHYVMNFSEERTQELMQAGAINQHNEFWKQHDTVKGNIYGSVPAELLRQDSVDKLKSFGWNIVRVNIFDVGQIDSLSPIIAYIKRRFPHYMLVKEVDTQSYLLLDYCLEVNRGPNI